MSELAPEQVAYEGETFWNISATNESDESRWVHNGSREECEALLELKLREWGDVDVHLEWSEHPVSEQ